MKPFPDVIRIEPSGLCQFKCRHCPIGVQGGHRTILPYDTFVQFFEMLPLVPRVLVLYHGGEPLLNKELEQMIAYAKDGGVHKTAFNTNAALLAGRDLSRLDELRVSFDGDSPQENDAIRTNSHFSEHAARVRELALSAKRPRTIIIYNARRSSARPADYLLDYFEGCNVVFRGIRIREWARLENNPHPTSGVTHCEALFETFTILSNGDVPMCCEDLQADDIQGNVYQNSPAEIWERMEARRQAFANGNYPRLCQSCWVTK